MPVYDRSYRRWDGKLKRHGLRFLPITTSGVRLALATRGGWFVTLAMRGILIVSLFPTLILFFLNYAVAYRPAFLANVIEPMRQLESLRAVQYPILLWYNTPFLMLYTVLFGSGLIARDRASGALPLYRSRPLTLADYVLGKAGVLAWLLGCLTLLPCLLLWLFSAISSPQDGSLLQSLPLLLPIVIHCGSLVLVYTCTMLGVSAICRRPMFAALIWFPGFWVLPVVAGSISNLFGWPAVNAVAPTGALKFLANSLYDGDGVRQMLAGKSFLGNVLDFFLPPSPVPVEYCWLSLLLWSGLGLLLLLAALRRHAVVAEGATR